MKNPPSPTCDQNPGVQVFTCHGLVPPEVGTKQPICGQDPDIFPFKILTHRYLFPKNRQISFYHNMYCNFKKKQDWWFNGQRTMKKHPFSWGAVVHLCLRYVQSRLRAALEQCTASASRSVDGWSFSGTHFLLCLEILVVWIVVDGSFSFINHPWFFSRLIDVDSMDDIGG